METPIPAEFKVVRSRGFNTVVLVDDSGYSYSCRSSNYPSKKENIRTWRCSKKNKQCKAFIVTENSWIIKRKNPHNHNPVEAIKNVICDPGILQDFFHLMALQFPLKILWYSKPILPSLEK